MKTGMIVMKGRDSYLAAIQVSMAKYMNYCGGIGFLKNGH